MAQWSAERWAASSGIAFGIVLIVSNFLAGAPPHYNASSGAIVSFLNNHHRALVVASILGGALIVLFLWFIASFAGMYREAGQSRLATIMYGAAVATVALGAVGDAIGIAATQLRTTIDPSAVQTLYGVSFFFYLKLMWPLAALALATALATHRSKVLPEWYTALSLAGAVLFVLAGLSLRMHGFFSPTGAMPMIGIVVLALWAVTSSVLCMQKHAVAHALPHAALSH